MSAELTEYMRAASVIVVALFGWDAGAQELPAAPASESDEAPREGEIVVTGKSDAAAARESAAPVTVVDTEQARHQTADLGEVLARTEGVGVRRDGGLGSNTTLSLNGFTGDQIRITIDGVPLEMSGFSLGVGSIPVDYLDRVEIYQGVVPVAFGADALGGVVNLVTRHEAGGTGGSAALQLGSFDTLRFTAGAHHGFEFLGAYVRAFGALDTTANDYPVDVQVADEAGHVRDAHVHRFHDGYDAKSGGIEAGVAGQPWAEALSLRLFASQSHKDLQSNPTMNIPYGEIGSDVGSYGLMLLYDNPFLDGRLRLTSRTGYAYDQTNYQDLGEWIYDWFGQRIAPRAGPGEVSGAGSDRTTWQWSAYERFGAEVTVAEGHRLALSVAPTYTEVTGKERRTAHDTLDLLSIPRSMTRLISGLSYTADLFDRVENVVMVKDYRYTAHTQVTSNFSPDRGDYTNQSFGYGDMLRVRLVGRLFAKASYEHATRLPRPDEVFGNNITVIQNGALIPETSDNYNAGLLYEGDRTPAGRFTGEVAGFMREAKGLIALLGQNDVALQYQNILNATSKGVQANVGWTSPHGLLATNWNATWMDYRNRSKTGYFANFEGDRMTNTPYLFANGAARVTGRGLFAGLDELSLDWHLRYVHDFYRSWESIGIKSTKQVIPRQITHSLALVYRVIGAERLFTSTVEVDNLTDEKTFDYYGSQRPGRAVYWKGTVEFL
jgi:hypothetical protein